MKNKIIATLVAFGLVGSASAIEINENLSINGFIDTSYTHVEGGKATADDRQELGLDEIELNFLFNVGGASGAIHVDRTDGRESDEPAQQARRCQTVSTKTSTWSKPSSAIPWKTA